MNVGEIKIISQKVKEISSLMKKLAIESPYNYNDYADVFHKQIGQTRNELFDVNGKTSMCVGSMQTLISDTANFLDKAAITFDENDYGIAKEISNS